MAASGVRLVLLGKPGAGKGTQAALLSQRYGVAHLSTGDLFRAAVQQGTPTGLEVQVFMDTGELVPDEIVIRVVDEHFAEGGPLEDGFILDGFPRTLVQAQELEQVLAGHPLDLVLDIEVPTDTILDRIAGRRVCINCGATYHVNKRPLIGWTCDVCGGENLGKLVVVNGDGNGDEVHERLLKEIDGRLDPARP
jgi:adenylate kinase